MGYQIKVASPSQKNVIQCLDLRGASNPIYQIAEYSYEEDSSPIRPYHNCIYRTPLIQPHL